MAEGKRDGMLNEAPGAAVCGAMEAERTPPVRRPARRDARWVGAGAEAMGAEGQVEGDGNRIGQRWGTQRIRDSEWVIGRAIERIRWKIQAVLMN